jgi:hypothetical protein
MFFAQLKIINTQKIWESECNEVSRLSAVISPERNEVE